MFRNCKVIDKKYDSSKRFNRPTGRGESEGLKLSLYKVKDKRIGIKRSPESSIMSDDLADNRGSRDKDLKFL